MRVSVTTLPAEAPGSEVVLSATETDESTDLAGETDLGSGITVHVDLPHPDRWLEVTVRRIVGIDDALLNALAGETVVSTLKRMHPQQTLATTAEEVVEPQTPAQQWLRVVTLDVLDRRVQLPLDQSLVDAERAVARMRAAERLPPSSSARGRLIGEALRMARQAAKGVISYLHELSQAPLPPQALRSALADLSKGYATLLDHVAPHLSPEHAEPLERLEPRDQELESVRQAWSLVSKHFEDAGSPGLEGAWPQVERQASGKTATLAPGAGSIDPELVDARSVALSSDPAAAEISLSRTQDPGVALVRVPAFNGQGPARGPDRLLARVLDRSGQVHVEGLLTYVPAAAGERARYQGMVRLAEDIDIGELRAEVFTLDHERAPRESDAELAKVRRATVFLREWRRIAVRIRLDPTTDASPALSDLARLLSNSEQPGADFEPAFMGGPSPADLLVLAGAGAAGMIDRDDIGLPEPIRTWLRSTQGAGEPMIAELAAVHQFG